MQYPVGVKAIALSATLTLMQSAHPDPPLLDFSNPEVVRAFRVINDSVMGGKSASRLSLQPGFMLFEGEVSLENNGGFASFRGPARFAAGTTALLLTVRGDGQRYKLSLKSDDSIGTAQYQAVFVAPRDWRALRFVPGDFTASFRGRAVDAPILRFGCEVPGGAHFGQAVGCFQGRIEGRHDRVTIARAGQ